MKKQIFTLALLFLALAASLTTGLTVHMTPVDAAMECTDITGCSSSDGCEGAGTASGCTLTCADPPDTVHCSSKQIH